MYVERERDAKATITSDHSPEKSHISCPSSFVFQKVKIWINHDQPTFLVVKPPFFMVKPPIHPFF